MSTWAVNWAYEQTVKPATRKFVLVSLANFADENGYCFPSQQTLASMTDQGVSTVREHLKALESEGIISREHRYAKQGGGRTSDGFWLQAPPERLKPPVKGAESKPPKAGGKEKHTAESQRAYRQDTAKLPPTSGDDHIGTSKEPSEIQSPHSRLMKLHIDRLRGNVSDPAAQGAAVKWILARFPEAKAIACYEFQLAEPWRKGHASWLTVKSRIAEWDKEQYTPQEKIVEDHGDWYLVESSCGDGGTSKRFRTAEAFAFHTGRDVEEVKRLWN